MKENVNNQLDKLAEKILKEASVENPSFNFTDVVMSKVEAIESKNPIYIYEPLISKKSWAIIVIMFLLVWFFAFFEVDGNSVKWFNRFDFSVIFENQITEFLSGIEISKYTSYSILFFGLMICIQIPFLKDYFDKRLEV